MDGHNSPKTINSGVPQGSVLSLTLFLLCQTLSKAFDMLRLTEKVSQKSLKEHLIIKGRRLPMD